MEKYLDQRIRVKFQGGREGMFEGIYVLILSLSHLFVCDYFQ
jgi:hypothetical protein